MRVRAAGLVGALSLAVLSGCGGESPPGIGGECSGSIRFHGALYVGDSRLNQDLARRGRDLGTGEVVDCDFRTIVDHAVVAAVKGVDSSVAIRVRGPWYGLYVAKDLPRAQWPPILRRR